MEDNMPPVAGLTQQVPAQVGTEPPALDVQSVIEAADLAHHRIRRSIHSISSMSHRIVAFVAHHQGSPDIAQLERGRNEVELQMFRTRGMR